MDNSGNTACVDQRGVWIILWKRLEKNPFILPLFAGLSFLYGFCVRFRKMAFNVGLFSTKRLPCPVICVGNLTVGGTGKTPAVAMVAKLLLDLGFNPAILSRGYKRKSKEALIPVSDGKRVLALPEDAGDEPYMLAKWLPRVPVVVGTDRYRSGLFAHKRFGADCFILDDGFQYLPLFRQGDILVINARDPFGDGRLLPWGRLREPLCALERASLIFINKAMPGQDLGMILKQIRKYNSHAPILETFYMPESIVLALDYKRRIPLSSLKDRSVLAFSGIAEPKGFFEQLKDLGASVRKAIIFEDHHWFSLKDMDRIKVCAETICADWIVTTQKDAVRLPPEAAEGIYVLQMKMGLKEDKITWEDILSSILVQ